MNIAYQLVRSHRRTLALLIKNGQPVVRAPFRCHQTMIDQFVTDHTDWIKKQLAALPTPKQGLPGELLPYLGDFLTLRPVATTTSLAHRGKFLNIPEKLFHLKNIRAWYREQARSLYTELIAKWCTTMNLPSPRLRLSAAHSRWGSCGQNQLNLSFWLLGAPLSVIEYVVIHELAHLRHRHHRPTFWHEVEKYCPNYLEERAWLKKHGGELHF